MSKLNFLIVVEYEDLKSNLTIYIFLLYIIEMYSIYIYEMFRKYANVFYKYLQLKYCFEIIDIYTK